MQVLRTNVLTGAQVKSYMVMLLRGVAYCHQMNIMHRVSHPHDSSIHDSSMSSPLPPRAVTC